jgi:phage-related protein
MNSRNSPKERGWCASLRSPSPLKAVRLTFAKPLHGVGSGILEIALPFKGDAFRVVYALQLGPDIWVIHAFQKKSITGIKTPKREIDLVKDRLKRLQEILK